MRIGTLVMLVALGAGPIYAQQTQPSIATQPAALEPGGPTPKDTLRLLNLALRDGNAAAIQAIFLTGDEPQARLISAMAEYATALAALHAAAKKAYGPEGANLITGDINAQSLDGLAAIEMAESHEEGESAVVKYVGATDPPVKLVKVKGRWFLPLSQMLDGADRATEERRLKELKSQADYARKTAEEIAAGKYREGPAKAAEVWRSRLLEPAATLPATREAAK